MLISFFWNATGVLSLIVGWLLLRRTIVLLRKQNTSTVLYTVCLGIVAGFAGIICGVLMLLGLDSIIRFDARPDIYFTVRLIVGVPFFYLGAFFTGTIAGRLLHKICHADAIVYITLLVTTLMILQPIAYGWVRFIWFFDV